LLITNLVSAQEEVSRTELGIYFLQGCYERNKEIMSHFDSEEDFWTECFREFVFAKKHNIGIIFIDLAPQKM
jgi:hypothetical protein